MEQCADARDQSEWRKAAQAAADIGTDRTGFELSEQALPDLWQREVTPHDVFWLLASGAALRAFAQGDARQAAMVHLWQAYWLRTQGLVDSSKRAGDRFAHEHHVRTDSVLEVKIVPDSCPECRSLRGPTFSPTEALATMQIPNPACTRGACTCLWELA